MHRLVLASALAMSMAASDAGAATAAGPDGAVACAPGTYLEPATRAVLEHASVIADAAERDVVLLGETHDDAEHHRWQLSVAAALHGRRQDMVLGFEAFPRRVQPVLDRWIAGELRPDEFLREVGWQEIWGFPPELYLPLFEFARLHRIPMVALNVERSLVARVGREGWGAVPAEQREGVGDPAPPMPPYRERLRQTFAQHQPDPAAAQADEAGLQRFVEAQLTWDRAMAQAIADVRARRPASLVVAVMGSEHVRSRLGVPHQLASLGIEDVAVLLPHEAAAGCAELPGDVADALFLVGPTLERVAMRPRLGLRLNGSTGGIEVAEVVPGSIAEAAGLAAGDLILAAAGTPVAAASELIEIVQRQSPGTWLPLLLRRDGRDVEAVAKFPAATTTE